MNRKRQFALNKLFNFCVITGLILAWIAIEFLIAGDMAWGIGVGIAALALVLGPAIFTPFCYSFDSEGVSLCYVFLPTERYLWKNIHAIQVRDISDDLRSVIIDFFYATVFSIEGKNVGERRSYMKGHIRKSFRTKYLLEKYWDGTITGYFFEDIKKWFNKRKQKEQVYTKACSTDEIIPMEAQARAQADAWLKPLIAQAKQHNLEVKAKYFYITEDFEELKHRPKEGYTYTVIAEIAHFNETDKNKVVLVSADLLYARIGKEAFRGVHNVNAREEFEMTFYDVLEEINANGIDSYCKDN